MTDLYAVIGNPVAHSKSPRIHGLFAAQTGQSLEYTAIQSTAETFTRVVSTFFDQGGRGLNVTVPFKAQAAEMAESLTRRATSAGAVNTLYLENGVLTGDNTDGIGLVRDLEDNHQLALGGKRVLVVGAGGAVRGILEPLLERQLAGLVIANRTTARAEALVREFGQWANLSCQPLSDPGDAEFDLIINGTSASLAGDLPSIPEGLFATGPAVYDLMYGGETVFNAWARKQGAGRLMDGLGMLVEQAAESFFVWRGVRPETAPVIETLRNG